MTPSKVKGYILAAVAAATYGTNPVFAVPLYGDGMNPTSVLLFRYGLCLPVLALLALLRGQSLRPSRAEILPTAVLGILMAVSSLTLFMAFNYMNAGVASTLLFIYPVLTAVLMSFFFHEPFRITTGICLVVMAGGLAMLLRSPEGGFSLSAIGCLLVLISALTYALYLVMTNVNRTVAAVPTVRLLFYQFLAGGLMYAFLLAVNSDFTLPDHSWGYLNLAALALLPSVISLACTTEAIHRIGSTPTAILGALEPLTAVILSASVLGQMLTPREMAGGVLILVATTLAVAADPVDHVLLRVRKLFPRIRK